MAFKKYGYYLKGNKIAVIEQSDATASGNLAVAHCSIGPPGGGASYTFGGGGSPGAGGSGGGGAGGSSGGQTGGVAGTANRGAGGGGRGVSPTGHGHPTSGAGGKGIVVIRYKFQQF